MAPLDLQMSGDIPPMPVPPYDQAADSSPSQTLRSCMDRNTATDTTSSSSILTIRTGRSRRSHRKKVQFVDAENGGSSNIHPLVKVQQIPHVSELSQEITNDIWFTEAEMKRMIREAQDTVISMAQGIPLSDDDADSTTRGLEYMTPSGFDIASSSMEAVRLVLEEQSRQKSASTTSTTTSDGFVLDMECLAAVMSSISRHRMRIAHLAGMKDARAVYGSGNFKLDPQAEDTAKRARGRSADARRERRNEIRKNLSSGVLAEQTRRRRGSRGCLNHDAMATSRHSTPSAGIRNATFNLPPPKTRSSLV